MSQIPYVNICGCFVSQPIGEFFIGKVPADVLRNITSSNIRRLENSEYETYSGIQRPLNPARVREIREYISAADATFPNSIIIAISSEDILEQNEYNLTIRAEKNVARIIDGQHRLAGFDEENSKDFDLVVSIFVDVAEEEQALIFSVINLKQTRVDKSLVYDLFELATTPSPQKTAHDVAKVMNITPTSPFYRKIKLLGRNPKIADDVLYKARLSQAAFIKPLLDMISEHPDRDRDTLKRGKRLELTGDETRRGLIFRKYFVNNDDESIIRILSNYFGAVAKVFPDQWNDDKNPLAKTIGYVALMRLLKEVLYPIGEERKYLREDFFLEYMQRAQGMTFRFAPEGRYAPAGAGATLLYEDLREAVTNNA